MNTQDKRPFAELLSDVAEVYGKPPLTKTKLQAYWSVLEKYPLKAIESARDLHLADPDRGRFMPMPADLVNKVREIIDRSTGRPSADEAWALALQAADEEDTVVWTDEIAQAYGAASEILIAGDKIGARMAFRAAYERIVRDSVGPAKWQVSLGHDPERREAAIAKAVQVGRLSHEQAARFLPAPEITADGQAIAGLLTGKVVDMPASDATIDRLREIRAAIGQRGKPEAEAVKITQDDEAQALEKLEKAKKEATQ